MMSAAGTERGQQTRTVLRKPSSKTKDEGPKLDEEVMEEVELAFSLYDEERTGYVHVDCLWGLFQALGLKDVEETEIGKILSDVDRFRAESDLPRGGEAAAYGGGESEEEGGASGRVTWNEFLEMAAPRLLRRDPYDEHMRVFGLLEDYGGGVKEDERSRRSRRGRRGRGGRQEEGGGITFECLRDAARELGEDIPDWELRRMISEADRKGNGAVDGEDFVEVMRKGKARPVDELTSDEESVQ